MEYTTQPAYGDQEACCIQSRSSPWKRSPRRVGDVRQSSSRAWAKVNSSAFLGINPDRVCTGQTVQGATNWQQYSTNGIYLDVNTAGCGFISTPLYFTSLGGSDNHSVATGATSIYVPTATGFRVYVHSPGITPALANQYGWHINWIRR